MLSIVNRLQAAAIIVTMRTSIEPSKAYRLLNHGPTVLVTTAHGARRNIMAAAWNMPLDFNPPRIAIVIDRKTFTRELMEAAGTFAINVPCRAQAEKVVQVGSCSGRDMADDKFSSFGVPVFAAEKISAPLVEGCVAWLECRVIPEPRIQNAYDLFVAEVLAAQADDRVFRDGHWFFEGQDALRTIHHVAGGAFFNTGEAFKA